MYKIHYINSKENRLLCMHFYLFKSLHHARTKCLTPITVRKRSKRENCCLVLTFKFLKSDE